MSHFLKFKQGPSEESSKNLPLLDEEGPVVAVPEVKVQKEVGTNNKVVSKNKQERANNLSLTGGIPQSAIEYSERIDFAEKQKYKNKWYQFILKVAGFSTEKVDKLWNKDVDQEKPTERGTIDKRKTNNVNFKY